MQTKARLKLIGAMLIFGTIGVFREQIEYSSAFIAFTRGVIGAVFILLFMMLTTRRFHWQVLKPVMVPLIISGGLIGANWILLFEAYNYTTIPVATLCYYMAPVFVMLAAPLVLKERLTLKKGLCVIVALLGMIPVSGLPGGKIEGVRGILLGLGAALLYGTVVILNKKFSGVEPLEKTAIQMAAAAVVILPYCLLHGDFSGLTFSTQKVALLLIMGILHTGVAYVLYFGALEQVPAQTAAIFSYLDPVTAIVLSCLLMEGQFSLPVIIGGLCILGATLCSEIQFRRKS